MKMSKKAITAIVFFVLGLILVLISVKFQGNPTVYRALSWSGFILGIIGGFKLMGLAYKK